MIFRSLQRWSVFSLSTTTLFGAAEVFKTDGLKLDTEVFGDALAAGQHRDVFHHGFTAIAEAGAFDGAHIDRAAQFVLLTRVASASPFDFFRDDQQRLADGLRDFFEDGQQVLQAADLLFVIQDVVRLRVSLPSSRRS